MKVKKGKQEDNGRSERWEQLLEEPGREKRSVTLKTLLSAEENGMCVYVCVWV